MQMINTKAEFDAAIAKGICFIDFYATWCGPCKMLSPIVEKLSMEYQGQITFLKVDVDQCSEVAAQYGIMSIPTLVMTKDGSTIATTMGYMPEADLKQFIESHI